MIARVLCCRTRSRTRLSLWLFYLLPIDDVFVELQQIDGQPLYHAHAGALSAASRSVHKQQSVRGQKYVKLIFFFYLCLFVI